MAIQEGTPVSLAEIVYGEKRQCFNCDNMILEAHLDDGKIVTLNDDNTPHKFTCEGRSFQLRVEQVKAGPSVGDRVSIPMPIRDCVEVVRVFPEWFEWRSLTSDARGTFPRKMMAECWLLCEHLNYERLCLECETA